jgi:hypothetical protein
VELFFASPSAELDNGMVRRFSGYGLKPEPCPKEALDKAMENIEKYFSFVGVVERYSESIDTMATLFGLAGLKEHSVNVTKRKPQGRRILPPSITAKIRHMNQLDLALYDWVSQQFDLRKSNPKPIGVMGFGRMDFSSMPLWKGVGGGRMRVMKDAGV